MKQNLLFSAIILILITLTASTIDLNNLFPYSAQTVPTYITKDNGVATDDALATLGRVLFYDKNLSANNVVSCSSCHKQEFAFSDTATVSIGLDGGLTGRHSMRLINARFSDEVKFFWDERAANLEHQVTEPIQDHIEMGFSGTNGDPDFVALTDKLEAIDYYQDLFNFTYGDTEVTEARIQNALAHFIRSIQSFDSKYDIGRAMVGNNNQVFPNFTTEENLGKTLFSSPPQNGGAGCNACHRAPEFDIAPNSLNNGIITVAGSPGAIDLTNTRAPTLRDMVNDNGVLNGPLMHDGSLLTLMDVINHYDNIPNDTANTNLDNRLNGGPGPGNQNLNLTQTEKDALEAFLLTLSGTAVYTADQWSDPFDANGDLDLIIVNSTNILLEDTGISIFPNTSENNIILELASGTYTVQIIDASGTIHETINFSGTSHTIDIISLPAGLYFLEIQDENNTLNYAKLLLN